MHRGVQDFGDQSCSNCGLEESTPWFFVILAYFVPVAIGLFIFWGAAYFSYRTCLDCFGFGKHVHDREVEDQDGITLQSNFPRLCQTPPSNEQDDPLNPPLYEQNPPKDPSVPPPLYSEIEEDSSGGSIYLSKQPSGYPTDKLFTD